MYGRQSRGVSLVDLLIVVILMAVLATIIIPQVRDPADNDKADTALSHLHTLRSQVELYKTQHDGQPPATLELLTKRTNRRGAEDALGAYGPYLHEIPANPLVDREIATTVTEVTTDPTAPTNNGGWIYNTQTGGVWLDHEKGFVPSEA